jgi:hypothetical protein
MLGTKIQEILGDTQDSVNFNGTWKVMALLSQCRQSTPAMALPTSCWLCCLV